MTAEFKPKITYRMAGTHIDLVYNQTPWEYLGQWAMSDRPIGADLEVITERMRARWPGNYQVVSKQINDSQQGYVIKWALEFDNPAEETMFRLRWA
jgi:hypothetical protein